MSPIQLLLSIFFLFALGKVLSRYRSNEFSLSATIFWVIFWAVAIVVVLLPNATFYFAHLVGVGRGVDLVIYITLALLFFIVFRLTVKQEKLQRDITKLTRKIALDNEKKI